jgi:hypothetical protein
LHLKLGITARHNRITDRKPGDKNFALAFNIVGLEYANGVVASIHYFGACLHNK